MTRILVMAALAVSLLGCASGREGTSAASDKQRRAPAPEAPGAPVIELLSYPQCPKARAMRESLRAALDSIGRTGVSIREVNVEALGENDPRRGWPAPTVLVDGRDLFGMPPPGPAPTTCRVYLDGDPGPEAIAARLQHRLCRAPCAGRPSRRS